MRNSYFILFRALIAIPAAGTIGAILYSQFHFSPIVTGAISAAGGAALFFGIGRYANTRLYKKHGITRQELTFILDNMKEARKKLSRLQAVFIRVRSIRSFKQMIVLNRLVRRIFSIVKKEPKRFYEAESFFYSHLDSVVELAEKYAYLNTQKIKDESVKRSLLETKETLDDLSQTLEKDLQKVLAKDIEHLSFELDVAKHSLKKPELTEPKDERSIKP
ncbi:5-bromo-4-chloroindolyl phosphate hydrolysis family protein [Bacillus xiapuensis]|uniref:5-bromo-4-chloroindolyl phosphate hydrolysis family protein n=1 Tax=Bacillus xiapuensis TaxID=2014075 RepID=UPI000C23AD38|nr:5-bromo-4-chloroindolyl phosphate hydrolysis family protein [Bacillus xiapuensis]